MTLNRPTTHSEMTLEAAAMSTLVSRPLGDLTGTRRLTLLEALDSCSPIPPSALFLGLAADGLPVLLNLRDPSPSPVLIAADGGAGKTRLLHVVARAIDRVHDSDRVRYAVITESPSEWAGFDEDSQCEGILSFHHALTTGYMASLAHAGRAGRTSLPHLVLLIDDFRALVGDGDLGDSCRWLLHLGASHGLWPLVTLSTSRIPVPESWLDPFRIRLLGHVQDRRSAASLSGSQDNLFTQLKPGSEFAMRERQAWLPFRLPLID
jgi:hypothetical protein